MSNSIPKFRVKHVGINNPDESSALKMHAFLCETFDLPCGNENESHIFAGDLFEVMKNETRGAHGHIALQTEDVDGAIAYLAGKGIGILKDTVRRDAEGHVTFAYLDLEVGGYAIHLTI